MPTQIEYYNAMVKAGQDALESGIPQDQLFNYLHASYREVVSVIAIHDAVEAAKTIHVSPIKMISARNDVEEFQGAYRFLSNFWPAPIAFGGVLYPTVEHAYQALKTFDQDMRERVAQCKTAGDAKRLSKRLEMRADWDDVKLFYMEALLRLKFEDVILRQKLVSTFPGQLIEGNTWGDMFWGKVNGEGENHLGKLLMKIRQEFVMASMQARKES